MIKEELLDKYTKKLRENRIYCQTQIDILELCFKADLQGEKVNPRDILHLIQDQRQKLQLL